MNFYRATVMANTEYIAPIVSQNITILNLGNANIFINFDDTATVESLVIPANFGRSFYFGRVIKNVHVISADEMTVQIDGLK